MESPALLPVGAAETVISPPLGTELAGYFSPRVSDGVISDLMAKAIVVGEGADRIALIACDLLAITEEISVPVRARVAAETGIPGDRVMICATHTHTGPELRANRPIKRNEEYMAGLPDRIADAAIAAAAKPRPACICLGRDHEEGLAFNRRFRYDDASEQFGMRGDNVVGVAGPTDPDLGVIAFRESPQSMPFAVIVNYSIHIDVTGGNKISADFPAVMTNVLRGVYGPDVIVLYVQGACGNINHSPYGKKWPWPAKGVWKSEQIGRALGGKAITIIEKALPSTSQVADAAQEILDVPRFPLDDLVEARVAQAREGEAKGLSSAVDKRLLSMIDQHDPDGRDPREVQALRIGDAVICGAPGEYFVEWGLEIKKWSPFPYTFIAELANAWVGYIPTYEAFRRGGYEATPIVSVRATPALGQMVADANFRLARALWTEEK
jgi:neutral ceramidase